MKRRNKKLMGTFLRLTTLALFGLSAAYAQRAPTIQLFAANPPEIAPGGTSMLVWDVSGATSLSIEPDIGVVTGPFLMVQPTATTTYTLTATSDVGTAQANVTVTVRAGGAGEGAEAMEGETDEEEGECLVEEAGAIDGMLTLAYSGSAQGDGNEVRVERQADVRLLFEKTPHGHWEAAAITGTAAIRDSYTSASLNELIQGEGAPNLETSMLRLGDDCTISARVVVTLAADNSTVFGVATSTVSVVYLEDVTVSGEAELKAHTWHFGGESGVSLTQGQSYVEGFAQDLGMRLGHDALGNAHVIWRFVTAE